MSKETGAAEALRQAAFALGEAADALSPDDALIGEHDEFCEWALEDWAEDDCQCLGRAGLVELARIQEEAEAKRPKAREAKKTPVAKGVPANMKKAMAAAEALGFECFTFDTVLVKPATYYATTTDAHAAGSLKTPEKTFPHWFLRARHLALPTELAFEASWADGFHSARVIDPTGREMELRANYEYGAGDLKSYGYTKEYAEKVLQERTYRYNDGDTYTQTRWKMDTWGEFTVWLDSLIEVFKVDIKPLTAVRKASKKKTEEDVMHSLLNPVVDYGNL